MSHQINLHQAVATLCQIPGIGITHAMGTAVPTNGTQGYAPGCDFIYLSGAPGTFKYVNTGTFASSLFTAVATTDGSMTVTTGHTLTVTDSLALLMGDSLGGAGATNKVRATQYLSWCFEGANTGTTFDLFCAPAALTVRAIQYTVSVQNGASTACVVKNADGATPSTGTTPLLSSTTGINLNDTPYTIKSPTLTATTADLTLAATDHISLVTSAAIAANKNFTIQIGFNWV